MCLFALDKTEAIPVDTHVSTYIYIYKERERETETETESFTRLRRFPTTHT